MPKPNGDLLRIALAQVAPVWLDRDRTIAKVVAHVEEAAQGGAHVVAFGEALVPGYPFWIERTNGARFDAADQKEMHALYMDQAVQIEAGHLEAVMAAAARNEIAVVLGLIERPRDRGGHSLYASVVVIDSAGRIQSVHRKLMPTYEERLAWSPGDGHGLRVHRLGAFTLGALNCWENWMPLTRAALYGLGEDLHVAIWPGSDRLTRDITRFIARESRSFVVSVSGLMRPDDVRDGLPMAEQIRDASDEFLANGGSCVAGPDGAWILEPAVGDETILLADLDHRRVREERQNFDPAGHYARPDVTRLFVDRRRQSTVEFEE